MLFQDRTDAGRQLAVKLAAYAGDPNVLVLALPRGGVPIGFEVAEALNVPLDIFVVRKLGVPGHQELAMGAIATGGIRVLNPRVVDQLNIPQQMIDAAVADEMLELERREHAYRDNRPAPKLEGHSVILVDDGLATGSTMLAAVNAVRQQQPRKLVVAVPVAASETCAEFQEQVDEVVCVHTPKPFCSVGSWYDDFSQTSDQEVRELLARLSSPQPSR